MKQTVFRTYGLALLFTSAISFPLINSNTDFIKDQDSFENRSMAKKPEFDINHLDPFPVKYDTFYNDHFNLRNQLIRSFNIYNVQAFRKSPVSSVIIGANNRLFYAGSELDSYQGINRLSSSELLAYKRELEYRKNYLEKRGIKFYFLVVPCKASIYGDDIGYEYFRFFKETWGEHLNKYLNTYSSVKPIQVFDTLREQKKIHELYYKLDNHWNDLGAFLTANEVLQRVHTDFPSVMPLALSDFEITSPPNPKGDLDEMLGRLNIFSESSFALSSKKELNASEGQKAGYAAPDNFAYAAAFESVREIKESKKPKLLIICDSFGNLFFPFVAEGFSKTVKIFDAWKYALNEKIVEGEKPDAVLVMVYEPNIRNLLQNSTHTFNPH